ncbi:kinase-like domain-containing protein [Rhizoctonia solani]|nr:kinase-like domain-containing protein [Rhizoctonia solani]
MMTYFYTLKKQGKILPVIGVLDLIEDAQGNVVLVVLEDWGCNLAELGRLSPSDFFHILRQCFEAVATLHTMGIAHLDISCYNFLCNSHKQVAVIDFEASRCFNETEVTEPACHSQTHSHFIYPHRTTEIPPEFRTEDAYQRRHCAYKLDVFALGVLILRFAKSSGFDCPRLVLLAEPLVACDPMRRPTAAQALVWFHKWCERVGVVLPGKNSLQLSTHSNITLSHTVTTLQANAV